MIIVVFKGEFWTPLNCTEQYIPPFGSYWLEKDGITIYVSLVPNPLIFLNYQSIVSA